MGFILPIFSAIGGAVSSGVGALTGAAGAAGAAGASGGLLGGLGTFVKLIGTVGSIVGKLGGGDTADVPQPTQIDPVSGQAIPIGTPAATLLTTEDYHTMDAIEKKRRLLEQSLTNDQSLSLAVKGGQPIVQKPTVLGV